MLQRLLLLCIFFFVTTSSFAQKDTLPGPIKALFEGKWVIQHKYYTNTIEIRFEPGKDYATFIDIGTGEAPPVALQAYVQGNMPVIPARDHVNDYIEMEIEKGQLIFRTQPTIQEEDGTVLKPGKEYLLCKKFRKVKVR